MTPTDQPDRLPNAWLFDRLNQLEATMRDQHQRLRSDMTEMFRQITVANDALNKRVEDQRNQLTALTTAQRTEQDLKGQYDRRDIAIIGSLTGAAGWVLTKGIAFIYAAATASRGH